MRNTTCYKLIIEINEDNIIKNKAKGPSKLAVYKLIVHNCMVIAVRALSIERVS